MNIRDCVEIDNNYIRESMKYLPQCNSVRSSSHMSKEYVGVL
jgi:hypothetical protein